MLGMAPVDQYDENTNSIPTWHHCRCVFPVVFAHYFSSDSVAFQSLLEICQGLTLSPSVGPAIRLVRLGQG